MQKAILALRDDVEKLFKILLELYQKKKFRMERIQNALHDERYYIKTGDVNKLTDLIEKNQQEYDLVDLLDFEISSKKEEICDLTGIELNRFNNFLQKPANADINEIKNILRDIRRLIKEISNDQEKMVGDMERQLKQINTDRESIIRIIKFS